MHQTSGSIAGDATPMFVVGAPKASCSWLIPSVHQLDQATVNGVMPSGGPIKRPRSSDPMFGV
jgi:hypothetical protein